jgi:hypothetical protein
MRVTSQAPNPVTFARRGNDTELVSIDGEALSVMRPTIILMAVIRASDRRGSGLICPMSNSMPSAVEDLGPCCGSVPMAEKLRYDRNASRT